MEFLELLSYVGSGILIVLVLLFTYYASRWYAKRMNRSGGGRSIKILERIPVSASSSMLIVEIQGKYYLIGASEKNFQLLTTLEDFSPSPPEMQSQMPLAGTFYELLQKAKNMRNVPSGRNGEDS